MHRQQQVFARRGVTGTQLASSMRFSRHSHDAFGIGVIRRGAQKSWSGRGPVEAGPGDVITCNPGEVHDGAPIGRQSRHWCMLYIEPEVISTLARDMTEGHDAALAFTAPVLADHTAARRAFVALFRRLQCGAELDDPGCQESLYRLLCWLGEAVQRPCPPDAPIRRAKEYIDDDPGRPIRLDELAYLCGLTKFQFLRAFARATGQTPHSYIIQARLQRAKRLIQAGEPIVAAALSCGFADQSHFTRHFARSYGFTPGRLRR